MTRRLYPSFSRLLLLAISFLVPKTAECFVRVAFDTRHNVKQTIVGGISARPFGVLVEAEIEPDRMGEFLNMIENNAIQSRKEPGCLRFDVHRSQESTCYKGNKPVCCHTNDMLSLLLKAMNKFYFYELYSSEEAVEFHKKQPHYEAWAKFKESGGTVASVSHKMDAEFVP